MNPNLESLEASFREAQSAWQNANRAAEAAADRAMARNRQIPDSHPKIARLYARMEAARDAFHIARAAARSLHP